MHLRRTCGMSSALLLTPVAFRATPPILERVRMTPTSATPSAATAPAREPPGAPLGFPATVTNGGRLERPRAGAGAGSSARAGPQQNSDRRTLPRPLRLPLPAGSGAFCTHFPSVAASMLFQARLLPPGGDAVTSSHGPASCSGGWRLRLPVAAGSAANEPGLSARAEAE